MPYTPGQLDEEEDQLGGGLGAPSVSGPSVGSTPSVGGTVSGNSEVTQTNSGGGAGTGFTNIDRYLSANKGAAGAVKQRADTALAKDQASFGTALGDATGKMNAQKPTADPTKLVSDVVGSSGDLQNAAIEAAKGVLNATYTGPQNVTYDVGNTEEAKRAKALSDSQSAGRQIATDNNTMAEYDGTGLEAIDRAIYGSAGEAPTLGQAAAAGEAQIGAQKAAGEGFTKEVEGVTGAIKKTADDTRAAFGGKAAELQAAAQAAADKANAAEAAAQAARPADSTVTGYGDFKSEDEIRAEYGDDAFETPETPRAPVQPKAAGSSVYEAENDRRRIETENYNRSLQQKKAVADKERLTLSPADRASYDSIKSQYPNISHATAMKLAKGGTNALRNKTTASSSPEWIPGSGPAQAGSFLDAAGLSAIGKVLGDESMIGATKGPEFKGGSWKENKIADMPGGADAAGKLPVGYTQDGNGNLTLAPGYVMGPGGQPIQVNREVPDMFSGVLDLLNQTASRANQVRDDPRDNGFGKDDPRRPKTMSFP